MSDFKPYSEKQQILSVNAWEGLRVLNPDCPTAKVAKNAMYAIVKRLLSIDKTGKINIDDFEFLVYDDEQPNAGFISGHNTVSHKNIVIISTGITGLCKIEDELAGILAHELGHYTYDKIYGENKNTVFQERFADLHALDLMIAGGYDPVGYSNVCETMRRNSSRHSFFDVHGSSMARKEDVDAYLTKLHKEQGDFKLSAPTGLYGDLETVLNKKQDKYKTYWQQLLENKFPQIEKNPDYNPPINLVFDLILSELKGGRLNNNQRIDDMWKYLENYGAISNPEIESTQKFIEQLIDVRQKDATVHDLMKSKSLSSLSRKFIKNFRGGKKFDVFAPVDETLDKINEFMTTRNPDRVKELSEELFHNNTRVFDTHDLKDIFGQPSGFKMPPRATAKGNVMPTDWLIRTARNISVQTHSHVLHLIGNVIGCDSDYQWMTDGINDKYSGKIIAVGKDEVEKTKEEQRAQRGYKSNHDDFKAFMFAINALYRFDRGEISASKVVNDLQQYCINDRPNTIYELDSVIYWLNHQIKLTDYKKTNQFLESELKELNNSAAFAEFYIKPFLSMLKSVLQTSSTKGADGIRTDNPPAGKTWFEYLEDVCSQYLNIKEEFEIFRNGRVYGFGLLNDLRHLSRKIGVQYRDSKNWNVNMGNVIEHISGVRTAKLHSVLMKFINTAVAENAYSAPNAANVLYRMVSVGDHSGYWGDVSKNKTIDAIIKQEEQNSKKLQAETIENYSVYATKEQWSAHNINSILLALKEEIDLKTDLHKIHRMLSAYGMLANNEQELLDILSKPTPTLKTDSKTMLETRLKEVALTYYMRNNKPITDIYNVLFATLGDRILEFSDDFADELHDYIEKNNLMPRKFEDLYHLHAVMHKLNLFSKEKSGHVKVLDLLVANIENMPLQDREKYSWDLLSGFYYADNSEMRMLNRESNDINFPLIRNALLEIYSDAVAQRLGRDDNTKEYFAKIKELSEFINQEHLYGKHTYFKRVGINKVTQGKLYRLISDKIQSQEYVSELLSNETNTVLSDADAQGNDVLGREIESLLAQLEHEPHLCVYSIEFLNRKLTSKSISTYRRKCAAYSGYIQLERFIKPSVLETFYHTFWSSGLEVRALIMNKLLNRAFDTLDKKIKYVCDMNFDKNNKYRKDAEMICDCVIKSFEPYEQDLILAAIASADENKQDGQTSSRSVGDGLRMFFENMGPAWVKFGQLLSYVPDLPSEIRRDLAKLKDRADMPARWDVYTWMKEAMPQDLYNRIERVDNVVGAGSFWMTAIVQLRNEQGETEKKVVQLLRPNADARADSGFKTIESAIKKLAKRNSSYQILQQVAYQAHKSAKYEVDVEIGNKQYEKAKELYGNISVNIDGTQYSPQVADWRYYGTGKNNMSYKIMDYAEGATLSRIDVSDDEKRKMALAYFTVEMINLFKGDVWDIDRHQGQQNFEVASPTNVNINIYDTGAQLPEAPDRKNKMLLAKLFFDLVQEVQSGKSIDSYLLKTIKSLDKLQNTLHIDVSYVSNVQKGLMALSDIIEYQKEIKDTDGNIIQKRKTLSAEDLKHAIVAVLQNPSIDKDMEIVIKGKVLASKLKRLDVQGLKELLNDSAVKTYNPVEITIADRLHNSLSAKFNKTAEEIASLDKPDDYIMGIPKQNVGQQSVNGPFGINSYQKAT